MLSFENDDGVFNYRVIGVLIHKGKILLQKSHRDNYWFLPGGRVEFHEESIETLKREMKEEINSEIQVERLICLSENFFNNKNKQFHELGLYYLAHFKEGEPVWGFGEEFEVREAEKPDPIKFKWFPFSKVKKIESRPEIIKEFIKPLPNQVLHFVTKD